MALPVKTQRSPSVPPREVHGTTALAGDVPGEGAALQRDRGARAREETAAAVGDVAAADDHAAQEHVRADATESSRSVGFLSWLSMVAVPLPATSMRRSCAAVSFAMSRSPTCAASSAPAFVSP